MAGMLAGVECARRRRFHHGGGSSDAACSTAAHGSRRMCFSLYAKNTEIHHSFVSSLNEIQQRVTMKQEQEDETLVGEAREAKQRLEERLSERRRKLETKRLNGRCVLTRELCTEAKKKGDSRRFSWARLGWSRRKQDECAVCLERFSSGETLLHLPCAHRFHSRCLAPWLQANSHCPCCRMKIIPQ